MRRKKGMWQFNSYGEAEKDSKNRRRRSLADYTCGEPFKKLMKLQTIILLLQKNYQAIISYSKYEYYFTSFITRWLIKYGLFLNYVIKSN